MVNVCCRGGCDGGGDGRERESKERLLAEGRPLVLLSSAAAAAASISSSIKASSWSSGASFSSGSTSRGVARDHEAAADR